MAVNPASPRRLPRAERERQILEVAHTQFAANGYAGVTMDGVAEQVGVTKPLLYNYWGNKERLYLACLEEDAESLTEAVGAAVANAADPSEALDLGLRAFFEFVQSERSGFRVLFDETLPTGGEVARRVDELRERIGALVAGTLLEQIPARARADARIEVEALSRALLGAAEGLAKWWLRSGELSAQAAADLLIATVQPGLRLRTQARPTTGGKKR